MDIQTHVNFEIKKLHHFKDYIEISVILDGSSISTFTTVNSVLTPTAHWRHTIKNNSQKNFPTTSNRYVVWTAKLTSVRTS